MRPLKVIYLQKGLLLTINVILVIGFQTVGHPETDPLTVVEEVKPRKS